MEYSYVKNKKKDNKHLSLSSGLQLIFFWLVSILN